MNRLNGQDWLNDELINYYGVMINNRSDAADAREKANAKKEPDPRGVGEERLLKAFCFNTNFFTMFCQSGFAKVKRWTRKVSRGHLFLAFPERTKVDRPISQFDTFEKDIIIIPVNHSNMHWCCSAVNIKEKRFEYYDSLGRPRDFVYQVRLPSLLPAVTSFGSGSVRTHPIVEAGGGQWCSGTRKIWTPSPGSDRGTNPPTWIIRRPCGSGSRRSTSRAREPRLTCLTGRTTGTRYVFFLSPIFRGVWRALTLRCQPRAGGTPTSQRGRLRCLYCTAARVSAGLLPLKLRPLTDKLSSCTRSVHVHGVALSRLRRL